MVVAYRTAHVDEVTDLYTFVTAPPFLHLFACTLVLLFGPGAFSIDYLIGRFILGSSCDSRSNPDASCESKTLWNLAKRPSKRNTVMTSASRRQFNRLALAAFCGALTGSVLGCSGGKQQKAWIRSPPTARTNPRPQRPPKPMTKICCWSATHTCAGDSISARIRARPT